ncbi:MAG: glycosyltransferase family 4 protein [Gammaproteobacteria bacterium]
MSDQLDRDVTERWPVAADSPTPDMPPLRIAVVATSLEILGGQGVQARALIEGLIKDGYAVSFIPINPMFPRGLRWIRQLPYLRTVFNQVLYLPSLLKFRHADVVHVFSASYWSFLLAPAPAIWAARCFGKRVVLHYHSGEAEDHLLHWGLLVHPWLRLAHQIVVPSNYLQRIFSGFGYRTEVIRNVVDTRRFAYRERKKLRPRLLSIRNLEPHYRVDVLIRAFGLLKENYPDATLVVAGCGSEAAKLRALANALNLDGIHFTGRIEPESVPALYDQADIFLNAAVIDNQPVSILEAFAAGLPVVTTGTGDIASMVLHGQAGIVVPEADPDAIAAAIERLLKHPSLAIRITQRAKSELNRYSWEWARNQWATTYRGTRI